MRNLLVPASILLLLAGGCGYTFDRLAPAGVRRIRVPLFENDTTRREMGFALTEAVVRELRRAGYRIADAGGGDAVLEGRITDVSETVLSEDPSGAQAQGRLAVTVAYRLVDARGRALASGRVSEGGEVVYARGESRPAGLQRAIDELARAVARGLEAPPE